MPRKALGILSASSSHRWLNCPPSARLCETYEDKGSDYAAEGTDAHSLCEYKLRLALGMEATDPTEHLTWYNEEMLDCANGYASYILELVEAAKETCADPVVLIEQRVDFSRWVEQGFGTSDAILISDGTLHVVDYKHGLGVLVEADNNPQMMCYALGALELFDVIYDIDTVAMTVYQPRRQNVSTFEMPKDDLYRWADEVLKPTAELAFAGDGNFLCGEWCGFCKAKHECRARAEANLMLAQYDFKLPPLLEDTEIEVILSRADQLVSWVNDIKEYALQQAISGKELEQLSDEDLAANIRHYCVYARVTPTDKIRIVKAWQAAGEIVAMTGDGVNDAPSLKAADIGCAMGITGTDVAKGAADMTLTDDNFATIVTAVKEGRGIFDNITKAVQFLLSCNLGEILTVFVAMILWQETPLMPIQLLWVNLVTDSLPALALGVEPVEHDVMSRKPRAKNESMFSGGRGFVIGAQGVIIGLLTLIAYYIGSRVFTLADGGVNIPLGETMAFATLALSQLVHAFNVRSSHSLFSVGITSNKYMLGAFALSLLLMLCVLLLPFMYGIFEITAMSATAWLIVAGLALAPLVIMEIVKGIQALIRKR